MKDIKKRLAQAILNSEYSYAELSKKTGIAKSTLQRYTTGTTKKIPIDVIKVIGDATHTSSAWIMGWEDEETEKKNDAIADIILKLRTDDTFVNVVSTIKYLSSEQLLAVQTFLSAFQK